MSKSRSFEDYDKETFGDKFVEKIKVIVLGLAGIFVGALPYLVLLNFQISSYLMLVLSGASAMAFYAVFGHFDGRKVIDHILLIIDSVVGAFLVYCTAYLLYDAPQWSDTLEVGGKLASEMSGLEKLFYQLKNGTIDKFVDGKMVLTDDQFSIWTNIVAAIIFTIIGLYIAFIFVAISRDKTDKNKK